MDRGRARIENLELLQRANTRRGTDAGYFFMREALLAALDGRGAWHRSLLDRAGRIDPRGPEAVQRRSDWILRGMEE